MPGNFLNVVTDLDSVKPILRSDLPKIIELGAGASPVSLTMANGFNGMVVAIDQYPLGVFSTQSLNHVEKYWQRKAAHLRSDDPFKYLVEDASLAMQFTKMPTVSAVISLYPNPIKSTFWLPHLIRQAFTRNPDCYFLIVTENSKYDFDHLSLFYQLPQQSEWAEDALSLDVWPIHSASSIFGATEFSYAIEKKGPGADTLIFEINRSMRRRYFPGAPE